MSNWRFPTPKIDKAATSTEGKLIFAAEQGKWLYNLMGNANQQHYLKTNCIQWGIWASMCLWQCIQLREKWACNELIKGHSPHFRSGRKGEGEVGSSHVWTMGENNKPHIPRAITSWLQREWMRCAESAAGLRTPVFLFVKNYKFRSSLSVVGLKTLIGNAQILAKHPVVTGFIMQNRRKLILWLSHIGLLNPPTTT